MPMQQDLQDRQKRVKGRVKATLQSVGDLDAISESEMVSVSEGKKTSRL